jgi:hypothetical protein
MPDTSGRGASSMSGRDPMKRITFHPDADTEVTEAV